MRRSEQPSRPPRRGADRRLPSGELSAVRGHKRSRSTRAAGSPKVRNAVAQGARRQDIRGRGRVLHI